MISSIAHPTDLSPQGIPAFEHALGLALTHRCRLDVLHVDEDGEVADWTGFPRVRETLQRWGALPAGASVEAIHETTGVSVHKVGIRGRDPVAGLSLFLAEHDADLIVMASHGRAGLDRLLGNSVSADLVQEVRVPTLILGPYAEPILDPADGRIAVRRILVPVDHKPDPHAAVDQLEQIAVNWDAKLDFLHVGSDPPILREGRYGPRSLRTIEGEVVETILAEARSADALGMPMAGVEGLLDAFRGSTTERVVRTASCPVLALPVAR